MVLSYEKCVIVVQPFNNRIWQNLVLEQGRKLLIYLKRLFFIMTTYNTKCIELVITAENMSPNMFPSCWLIIVKKVYKRGHVRSNFMLLFWRKKLTGSFDRKGNNETAGGMTMDGRATVCFTFRLILLLLFCISLPCLPFHSSLKDDKRNDRPIIGELS